MELTALTSEELDQLADDIVREKRLREIPVEITRLNRGYLAEEGTEPGQDWRQPTGAHDAYPLDWEVIHDDKTWASLTASNVWEPGVANWREVVSESSTPPEWVQPSGAQDAYNTGDRVTFEGEVYTSLINANTWSPTAYPAGWQIDT